MSGETIHITPSGNTNGSLTDSRGNYVTVVNGLPISASNNHGQEICRLNPVDAKGAIYNEIMNDRTILDSLADLVSAGPNLVAPSQFTAPANFIPSLCFTENANGHRR